MINSLIVVGKNIKYNDIFMEYVKRQVESKIGHIDALYHLDNNDTELFLSLEEIIVKSKNIVLVTRDAFALVSKVVSTLTDDSVVLKGTDILAPSKAIEFQKNAFLLEHGDKLINVLKVQEHETLPPIMITPKQKSVSFFLIDAESEIECEKLENIAKINDLTLHSTELIAGLRFVKTSNFEHAQQDGFMQALAFGFKDKVLFGEDLSEIIAARLIESETKITCAESCTGGLLASEIVKNSGVSSIFNGSVVSYANEIKEKTLGVEEETLIEYGAVSVQTVYEMLEGALVVMDADMAIAVSGVAGPTGGTKEKPVGTVYIGAKSKDGETFVEKLLLNGDRRYIQQQAVLWGFKLILKSSKKLFFNFLPKSLDN